MIMTYYGMLRGSKDSKTEEVALKKLVAAVVGDEFEGRWGVETMRLKTRLNEVRRKREVCKWQGS
jgi:hypothetical protein